MLLITAVQSFHITNMAGEETRIPEFKTPTETESPAINSLLNEQFIIEHSFDYSTYKIVHMTDSLELSKSNSAVYIYRDEHGYLNCRRIFIALDFYATDDKNEPLKPEYFIGGTNVAAHAVSIGKITFYWHISMNLNILWLPLVFPEWVDIIW